MASSSLFSSMKMAPPDPILVTASDFKADPAKEKMNLGIGAYRTEQGKPLVLPVVIKAEEAVLEKTRKGEIDKEYAPIDGLQSVVPLCQKLILGSTPPNVASVQTLSGTGSLRVAAEFLKKHVDLADDTMYYSDPTWGNHPAIFEAAGMKTAAYPFWDAETKSIKFQAMIDHMKSAKEKSLYLIHPCAHNPTGVDPTEAQWKDIMQVCVEKRHIVILDSAYQGYASGDLVHDRKAIEMFMATDLELFICQSFAKNLGLYGERIGMLHVRCATADLAKIVLSQLKLVIRPMYSSPPIHGALLLQEILGDPVMYKQWEQELKGMADRIIEMRHLLRKGLEDRNTPGTWNHITDQIGMFSFTGLSKEQCELLIKDHHIYLLKSGRISMAGINKGNVAYMVNAVDTVVRQTGGGKAMSKL